MDGRVHIYSVKTEKLQKRMHRTTPFLESGQRTEKHTKALGKKKATYLVGSAGEGGGYRGPFAVHLMFVWFEVLTINMCNSCSIQLSKLHWGFTKHISIKTPRRLD